MRFADVKNDVAFRKIFGDENRKVILISFLNAVMQLSDKDKITEVTLMNPYQLPILPNLKASIIDVKAKDGHGNTFIVEMHASTALSTGVADVAGMDKRLLYYTSKEYSQQMVSGGKYTDLNPVIFIGIFDFTFTEDPGYLSHHAICNVKTRERVIRDMNFYFIELPKFSKIENELQTVTDKWLFFIKEAEHLTLIPSNTDDEGLKEAYAYANKNTWTQAELDAYDYAEMREQDERGRLEKAVEKAITETKSLQAVETVLKLHNKGKSAAEISELLDLPLEQVEKAIREA